MPRQPKLPPSDRDQSKRFTEAARELECDDDKGRFEKRLGKIAKAKPKAERHEK